ncbi:D-alanyl-D-alanine carboxypeptidase [Streptomyces sp. NPDC050161]|uniref:D-alanyl-D-alanine carboxypeptidase n=1 Tax=Streptomyces sp. NPDC050161 TaxID=3365604 RepID=UPI00379287C0
MAGESPDKSDKKQSSGETARSGSDPRLTVFRGEPDEPAKKPGKPEEPEESAGESEKSVETPDGADGAGGASEGAEASGAAPAETSGTPGTSEATEASETSEAPEASGDAADEAAGEGGADRLRDVVAAWVAGKDESDESDDASSDADRSEAGDERPDRDTEAAAAKPGAKAADGAADGEASGDVKGDAATAADAGVKGEGAAGAKAGRPKSGSPKSERPAAERAGSAAKGDAEPESGAEAAAEVVDRPTAVFKNLDAKPGEGEAPVDDATRAFAVAKPKGKAQDKAQDKTQDKGASQGKGEEKDAGKGKKKGEGESGGSEPDGGSGPDEVPAEPVDQATAVFKITPPEKLAGKPAAKADAESDAKSGDGKAADGKADKAEADKAEADKGEGKGAATASVGSKADAKADAKPATSEKEPGNAAEKDAERTSQFIALKSDDIGAEKSIGKTADGKIADKPADKAAEKTAGETPAAPEKAKSAPEKAGAQPAATGATAAATGATDARQPQPGAAGVPEAERTRQEPLPPLDLLAQLTNTPPPPETTFRTVVRRFKIWTPLVILLAIIFVVVQSVRTLPTPTLAVGSSTSFTFKGGKFAMPWPDQGQSAAEVVGVGSLGTSGQEKPVPTASVAKVMTAYVILRDHPLKDKTDKGETITIDAQAEADSKKKDESRVPLKEGQKFNENQMLQMLMIPSGNNAARQLARWDSGSEAAFVKKMNAAAQKLGMSKTTYTDPSGLDKSTVSTAVDQLKLAGEVMKNAAFRAVVATENVQIEGLPERLFNNNSLLTTMAPAVRGIKTGSSTPAGGAFMWAAYHTVGDKDQLLLGVTMDQRTSSSDPNAHLKLALDNSAKVIKATKEALVSDTVVKKGQVVGYVDDGLGSETPVVATKDLTAVGWPGMKASFSIGDGGKTIPHAAKAGTKVGVLTVGSGSSEQKVPVALQQDLTEPTFGAKLTRIG